MDISKLPDLIKDNSITGLKLVLATDLTHYSTIKLQAKGNLLLVESVDVLKWILPLLNENRISYKALGLGANQILSSNDDLLLIKLKLSFNMDYFSKKREVYHLPASLPLSLLVKHAQKFDLKGWEYMAGIPATVGGAAYMNAGINAGEFGSLVKKVYLITNYGKEKEVEIDKNSYEYRKNKFVADGEIIYAVDIVPLGDDKQTGAKIENYLTERSRSQPWKEKTCGCVFKNISKTCRVGHYIDIINLKGFTYKGISISHKHGNFFVNKGGALQRTSLRWLQLFKRNFIYSLGKNLKLKWS